MQRTIILGASVALAVTALATPADARRKPAVVKAVTVKTAQAFKAADTDADRQLSSSEWTGAGYNPVNFTRVDSNQNGTVGFWESLMAVFASLKGRATN
jgi:hypothetical protein